MKRKSIVAINSHGRIVHRFPSVAAVRDAGYSPKLVHDVLIGRQSHHRNYRWRAADEHDAEMAAAINAALTPHEERFRRDGTFRLPEFVDEFCTVEPNDRPLTDVILSDAFDKWLLARGEWCDSGQFLRLMSCYGAVKENGTTILPGLFVK